MNDLEQAARQALEALECHADIGIKADKQIAALREALENHESAYQRGYLDGMAKPCIDCADRKLQAFKQPKRKEGCAECGKLPSDGWALYCVKCSEPVRKWVGLTDEEVRAAYCTISDKEWAIGGMSDAEPFARAIEAKLKEKNT